MKNNLAYWRKKRMYSQRSLGEAVGVQAQTIANYETARHRPRIDTLRKISEVLGVSAEQLFEDDEQPASLIAS
jgi:transcriptional regulator with XRE-family HTH domain